MGSSGYATFLYTVYLYGLVDAQRSKSTSLHLSSQPTWLLACPQALSKVPWWAKDSVLSAIDVSTEHLCVPSVHLQSFSSICPCSDGKRLQVNWRDAQMFTCNLFPAFALVAMDRLLKALILWLLEWTYFLFGPISAGGLLNDSLMNSYWFSSKMSWVKLRVDDGASLLVEIFILIWSLDELGGL